MVFGTVSVGLAFAVLADRVKYEALAKAILFMPMAISFVGAGVIWKFVYDYGTQQNQIGLLNSIITSLGGQPVAWLSTTPINTYMIILVGIWIWSGFCMTILAAALKSVPDEILEAARVDGATEWTVFWTVGWDSIAGLWSKTSKTESRKARNSVSPDGQRITTGSSDSSRREPASAREATTFR